MYYHQTGPKSKRDCQSAVSKNLFELFCYCQLKDSISPKMSSEHQACPMFNKNLCACIHLNMHYCVIYIYIYTINQWQLKISSISHSFTHLET